MNDAEKEKLEELLRKAAPVASRLDGPTVVPERVAAALNKALDRKFPLPMKETAAESTPAKVERPIREAQREPGWFELWRWWLGLATAAAAVVLIVKLNQSTPIDNQPAIIQVAMLDSIGTTRGTNANPLIIIQQQWKDVKPVEFSDNEKLKLWQQDWGAGSNRTVAKIVYDRDAQELRITIQMKGRPQLEKVFRVQKEQDLPLVLESVKAFIKEQTR